MSIANYTELQAALGVWLDRTDLADIAPDFIKLAENYINYGGGTSQPLRVRQMQIETTLTPTNNIITLPDDFLSEIAVVSAANPSQPLQKISVSGAAALGFAGPTSHYRILGNELKALPLSDADVTLTYYQALPALSEVNATNWLLTRHSDLYLRASQMMAAEFIKDYSQAALLGQVVDRYIAQLNDGESYDGLRDASLTLEGPIV